jgi:hypothetical protein
MSGDFLGIGHKLRHTREAESRGQRFVRNHWKFEFLLRSGGRGWSFEKSRDIIFGGPLDEAKKKLFGFENKKSPWISGRSQVDISPISSFFSLPTRSDEDKILIQFFDARSASDFIKRFYFWLFIRASII